MLNHPATILLIAFALDLLIGDPVYPLHPIRLIGRLIQTLENVLRRDRLSSVLLPLLSLLISIGLYLTVHRMLGSTTWILDLYMVYSLLALGDLIKHARSVEHALKHSLDQARQKVQWMVGRDPSVLDANGVARATIESVAENFVDGFLSPVFWFTTGVLIFQTVEAGVALMLVFKVISTLDSMVGYKNERYLILGRVSARLDDMMNFIPARLSIALITLCSSDWKNAWHIGWRDRLKHASPNSAHAEAAMAGALGLRLGGPTVYPHGTVEKPWIGDGTPQAGAKEIRLANRIILRCGTGALLGGAFFLWMLLRKV